MLNKQQQKLRPTYFYVMRCPVTVTLSSIDVCVSVCADRIRGCWRRKIATINDDGNLNVRSAEHATTTNCKSTIGTT